MLIKSYCLEYCRPPNPVAMHLRGLARLDADITELLPYLNTVLKAHLYMREPPSLTIKYRAKLITFHPRETPMNILRDEAEAEEIMAWLQGVINDTWERREAMAPNFEVPLKPHVLEILKASAPDQLPGLRRAHLHGLCHPGERRRSESPGLPRARGGKSHPPAGLSRTIPIRGRKVTSK